MVQLYFCLNFSTGLSSYITLMVLEFLYLELKVWFLSLKLLLTGSRLVEGIRRKWLVSSTARTCGHLKDVRKIDLLQRNVFFCNTNLEFSITTLYNLYSFHDEL